MAQYGGLALRCDRDKKNIYIYKFFVKGGDYKWRGVRGVCSLSNTVGWIAVASVTNVELAQKGGVTVHTES